MFRKKFAVILALLCVLFLNAFLITQMKFLNDGNFVRKYILVSNSSFIQSGLAKLGFNNKIKPLTKEPKTDTETKSTEATKLSTRVIGEKNEETVRKVWDMHGQMPFRYAIKPSLPSMCNVSVAISANSKHAESSTAGPRENILVFFQLPAENFTDRADLRSELSAIENVKVMFVLYDSQNRTTRNDMKFESKRFKDLLIIDNNEALKNSSALLRLAAIEWTVKQCKDIDYVVVINYVNKDDLVDLKKVIAEKVYANMNFQCLLSAVSDSPRVETTKKETTNKDKSTLVDPMELMREEALQDLTKSFIICDDSSFVVSANNALESYYNFLHKSF